MDLKKKHIIKAAKMLINNRIKVNDLITHRIGLKNYSLAFKIMNKNKFVKIIMKPDKEL